MNIQERLTDSRNKNIEECGYPYKFSVVMAVYKVEEYIREAIDSLINQTIGFEENIQLICVDDGSPDSSGAICDEYAERYPENIIVIHKENGGASSARNTGLQYATGRYLNFLDSDDSMSDNVFQKVYDYFYTNEQHIDIISIPLILFNGRYGNHILNYKFSKGTRIIDLRNEFKCIQMHIASSFIKAAKLKEISFDTNLTIAEDAKEVAKILIDKQQLGVVSGCNYNYRIRKGANLSATQEYSNSKEWYTSSIEYFSLWAYDFYRNNTGYIPLFIQYTVMYDIQWKIKPYDFPENTLSDEEKTKFWKILQEILAQTDDSIILEEKYINTEHKYFLLYL